MRIRELRTPMTGPCERCGCDVPAYPARWYGRIWDLCFDCREETGTSIDLAWTPGASDPQPVSTVTRLPWSDDELEWLLEIGLIRPTAAVSA